MPHQPLSTATRGNRKHLSDRAPKRARRRRLHTPVDGALSWEPIGRGDNADKETRTFEETNTRVAARRPAPVESGDGDFPVPVPVLPVARPAALLHLEGPQ